MCSIAAFNQEKSLVGAFSVIVKTDGSFAALVYTCILCLLPRAEQEQWTLGTARPAAAAAARGAHRETQQQ